MAEKVAKPITLAKAKKAVDGLKAAKKKAEQRVEILRAELNAAVSVLKGLKEAAKANPDSGTVAKANPAKKAKAKAEESE